MAAVRCEEPSGSSSAIWAGRPCPLRWPSSRSAKRPVAAGWFAYRRRHSSSARRRSVPVAPELAAGAKASQPSTIGSPVAGADRAAGEAARPFQIMRWFSRTAAALSSHVSRSTSALTASTGRPAANRAAARTRSASVSTGTGSCFGSDSSLASASAGCPALTSISARSTSASRRWAASAADCASSRRAAAPARSFRFISMRAASSRYPARALPLAPAASSR